MFSNSVERYGNKYVSDLVEAVKEYFQGSFVLSATC
jgi:hypothetical protein